MYDPNTINYKNPRFTKNGFIDVEIEHPNLGWIPCTCSPFDDDPSDTDKINMRLFDRLLNTNTVAPYIKPVPSQEYCVNKSNVIRQDLLYNSDWTQLPDIPAEIKNKWANYRQQLRDITKQPGYPMNITWPKTDPDGNPLDIIWPPELD